MTHVYVATFTDDSGFGYQVIKKTRKEAKEWLKKKFAANFADELDYYTFEDHSNYGYFSAKIKKLKLP